ncbi:MAG: hypothetical protein HS111_09400 [Kofleriaceae bacterium]|nr:hypothetical protein [Kofleriaceae bacterium]MCL4224897.1 hypothetical protein [Myxococcales bacterium]
MSDDAPLAALGIELATDVRLPEVRTEAIRVARRLHATGARAIGFVPTDRDVAVPPLLVQLGAGLCDLTGATIAIVDANARYPGLRALVGGAPGDDGALFSTRWLAGSLALLTPARVEQPGEVVPALARLLLDGSELFAHVLCDLTGFELFGEHASAAACMDGVVLVGRAHRTREDELRSLAALMPADRFLGVLLVG